eukprot:GHVU01170886.1.p2 GENE.GHVU01170886.1~~GHVU01170886.1.p2  ORF type:complete len:133 (+),score=6.43 GHVU01170886.1:527-925(+)
MHSSAAHSSPLTYLIVQQRIGAVEGVRHNLLKGAADAGEEFQILPSSTHAGRRQARVQTHISGSHHSRSLRLTRTQRNSEDRSSPPGSCVYTQASGSTVSQVNSKQGGSLAASLTHSSLTRSRDSLCPSGRF